MGSWFNWSRDKGLPVECMEDLVLVYGCTLVTSWAVAAFYGKFANAQIFLTSRALNNGGASFVWGNLRGKVEFHDSQLDPVCSPLVTFTRYSLNFFFYEKNGPRPRESHCVFIKCFRAKRIMFWTKHLRAAAEPLPDDPDNTEEDEIQVTQVADFLKVGGFLV